MLVLSSEMFILADDGGQRRTRGLYLLLTLHVAVAIAGAPDGRRRRPSSSQIGECRSNSSSLLGPSSVFLFLCDGDDDSGNGSLGAAEVERP